MSQTYRTPADVVFTDMSGAAGREGVLLNIASRRYYSLNETGLEIYERLVAGDSAAQVVARLIAAYDLDAEHAAVSIAALTGELTAAGLLEVIE